MIAYIEGTILKKIPGYIIILANGVGYEIFVPLSTYEKLKDVGENENLFIYTLHKEDVFNLFGFKTEEEKDIFKLLLTASGIGPKMALKILSQIKIESLKLAVSNQDPLILSSVSGVGKKRAEKIIFELKEKFKTFYGKDYISSAQTEYSEIQQDAIMALESLGYQRKEAVETVMKINPEKNDTADKIVKESLKLLSKV